MAETSEKTLKLSAYITQLARQADLSVYMPEKRIRADVIRLYNETEI
jgi:hypothetical protein